MGLGKILALLLLSLFSSGQGPHSNLVLDCETTGAAVYWNGKFCSAVNAQELVSIPYLRPVPGLLAVAKSGYKPYLKILCPAADLRLFIRLSPLKSHYYFLGQIKTGRQPKDVLFSPDGRYLMITLLAGPGLNVYDLKTKTMRLIEAPPEYRRFTGYVEGVFNPAGTEFWFTQMHERGMIYVLDMTSFTITHSMASGGNWTKVGEFSPDGRYYLATNWISSNVSVIEVAAHRLVKMLKVAGTKEPRGVGFSADGHYAYVVYFGSGHIVKFDATEGFKTVKVISTGGTNGRFRPDYQKGVAYINNMLYNCFFVFDLNTDQVVRRVNVWSNPNNLKLSPDKRYVYISNRGPNNPTGWLLRSLVNGTIQVFDSADGFKQVEELRVGNQPIGISLTWDNKILAISNFQDDTVDFYAVNY